MAAITQLYANEYGAIIVTDKAVVYQRHLYSWRLIQIKQQITLGELTGRFSCSCHELHDRQQ